ncbi:MAG: ABC transporter ATP-binding protein [Lachnospiraceae bacterium]|nr:ABC transporter ATP-binding protein [Lachnospiraceae bacterium]
MLEIRDIRKSFGRVLALNNISINIEENSIYGLVGPNGAGKTTLIKILAGLTKSDSGSVSLFGTDIIKDNVRLKDSVGYMPDFFGVYDNLKVDEYMDFYEGAYYVPYEKRGPLTDELLETVRLADKKHEYVDTLSRGMKQRLCLARSLINDPKLLLLDEPASGLDPAARVLIRDILRSLKEKGKTIIISSHILPELSELCTDIGIMDKGSLVLSGKMSDIMKNLSKNKLIEIKLLNKEDLDKLKNFLNLKGILSVAEEELTISFETELDLEEISVIISEALASGIMLAGFGEKLKSLEDVFMQIAGGEGQ